MQILQKIIKITAAALALVCGAVLAFSIYIFNDMPDSFSAANNSDFSLGAAVRVVRSEQSVQPVGAVGSGGSAQLKLFGLIPIKDVRVTAAHSATVTLCGTPFGVKLYTDGVMVVGLGDVPTDGGACCPAKAAGISKGDLIVAVDGERVYSNAEIAMSVGDAGGRAVTVEYLHDGQRQTVKVTPARSSVDSTYKLGMWVRDSTAGIGTLTFYDPSSGVVAGLGHGICDVDTGAVVPVREGQTVGASIIGVTKGAAGKPGELCGVMNVGDVIGDVAFNSDTGLYSVAKGELSGQQVSVAVRQEVKPGEAQILTTVDGGRPQSYTCLITDVDYSKNNLTKNITLKVTDERLLAATGGIVQGMSGSPVIQNGKLVGAVTHVLVDDPTKGYAIFAENMLETARSVGEEQLKEAS